MLLCGLVLDGSQRGINRAGAGAGAQHDERIHLQDVAAEQDADRMRQKRRDEANR